MNTETENVSGSPDPEGESPWRMQLVVHVEKSDPPARTAVCEAAATAVAALLADERSQEAGEWHEAVSTWSAGRIGKHCRRARGAAWSRAEALPGVTSTVQGAEVRAFVPTRQDEIPQDLAKLQMSGSELADPIRRSLVDPKENGALVVSICPEPFLPLGKAAAAAGHAAQLATWLMPEERYATWQAAGFPVEVEHPSTDRYDDLQDESPVRVVDAGLTAVPTGTVTSIARWA